MPLRMTLFSAVPDSVSAREFWLQITWTDSTDPAAVSNNIYRSTVSGGPYTKIINIPNGVQVFNDFSVTEGVNYFYVLTEVNNTGAESGFSVEQSGIAGPK